MRMAVPRAIRVRLLMLVKDDFETASKRVPDAAECAQIGDVFAAFPARLPVFRKVRWRPPEAL